MSKTSKNYQVTKFSQESDANAVAAPVDYILTGVTAPAGAKRLNMPRLVKGGDVPIGATVSGEVVGVVENFTGKKEMDGSKVLHMKAASGAEFLFPLTGVVKKALASKNGKPCDASAYIGSTLYITRQADGVSGKYKKSMFMFDVFVGE
jgi:hypothetical protein